MKSVDLEAYLSHYDSHLEDFTDEPPLGGCGTIDIKSIQEGHYTAEDRNSSADHRRKRWEEYHVGKAKSLGFQIDSPQLLLW